VFKLGHTFKTLHKTVTLAKDGIQPVLPEDLIFRFAQKLEFGTLTNKVAEDAVRMVQRMSLDWMVMGRRPSGVCGACLILAARMNNFRRTITEVVYIVKVTTHTIQKRLNEFKVTPSSALTVEEFLNNEFLESSHDPPSFYEKSEEWQKNKKKRKRRRGHDRLDEDDENSGSDAEGDEANKRQRTAEPSDQPVQSVELRRDADGFAIPPQPTQSHDIPIDPDLIDDAIEDQSGTSFDKLVAQFGDAVNEPDEENDDASSTGSASASTSRRRGRPRDRPINVPAEWASIEDELESEMSEMISDPNTIYHATSYAQAKRRAAAHMLLAEKSNPSKNVNMDVHIGEDEFEDDPEVLNCMLAPEEVEKKEKLWVNANKDWLRKQQVKMWQKKAAENGPPKAKRNRKKKPRIGEGQLSAASSPAEAAINVMKERAFSKKINYQAIADIFEGIERLGERLGSAGTSRITSRAGSEFNDSMPGTPSRASSMAPSAAGSVDDDGSHMGTPGPVSSSPTRGPSVGILRGPKLRNTRPRSTQAPATVTASATPSTSTTPAQVQAEDEEGDDDDYVSPRSSVQEEEVEDWRSQMRKSHQTGEEGDEFQEDEEEYDDYGDIEPGGIADDGFGEGFGDADEDLDEDD
jgi:transcription factor IIIB subunit 2